VNGVEANFLKLKLEKRQQEFFDDLRERSLYREKKRKGRKVQVFNVQFKTD